MLRWPPPPATSSTLFWESVRGGEIREDAAVAASAGNELDTVLGVGEERYKKMLRWSPPQATCSTLCWESGRRDTRR